ncbi:MAG: flagellar hook-basal body complex protein FliE [Lachnospiraceae bacterium]|nr:flagellar hook-basal body complex protein FliE [Lachnospiraceae bacterium]
MDDFSSVAALRTVRSDYITEVLTTGKTPTQNAKLSNEVTDTFADIYNNALGLISSTNNYVTQAQQAEIDFALGNISSTHELAVIQQKANVALQYTVAIRDRIVDAYKEIMNIQI